jgi:transglutaminase-like putative cysteine protease
LTVFRALPRAVTRPLSICFVLTWIASMAVLVHRAQSQSPSLATDLARYGSAARWRGVYYRGEKIGFTVSQIVATDDGFELQEDGRLQMTLLGAEVPANITTTVRVDRAFALRAFAFSLDPGTGAVVVKGAVDGRRLALTITTKAGTTHEERVLDEPPALSQNLPRRLAEAGLVPGARHEWTVFDPATLRNAPVTVLVGKREIVQAGGAVPAFRVELEFAGLRTTSWITDTGEVVREESPTGLMTVRESPDVARRLAVGYRVQTDILEQSAVVPQMRVRTRILEPRDVRRVRLELEGVDLASPDLQGAGQTVEGEIVEIRDAQGLVPGAPDHEARRYLAPEPLIESDAPEIRAEAERAIGRVVGTRARAERLTRHVNAILEKKPTVSLPSAREVLRTRVGDCNEHTALYVALARSVGIPTRIAVGLTYMYGAFYYHAWPEVYIEENGRGLWLPVDPTLDQFPADATHLRLARGGLDRQAAIIGMIGRIRMRIVDLEVAPGSTPVVVGGRPTDMQPLALTLPAREAAGCWSFDRRPPDARPVRPQPR